MTGNTNESIRMKSGDTKFETKVIKEPIDRNLSLTNMFQHYLIKPEENYSFSKDYQIEFSKIFSW